MTFFDLHTETTLSLQGRYTTTTSRLVCIHYTDFPVVLFEKSIISVLGPPAPQGSREWIPAEGRLFTCRKERKIIWIRKETVYQESADLKRSFWVTCFFFGNRKSFIIDFPSCSATTNIGSPIRSRWGLEAGRVKPWVSLSDWIRINAHLEFAIFNWCALGQQSKQIRV